MEQETVGTEGNGGYYNRYVGRREGIGRGEVKPTATTMVLAEDPEELCT